MLFLGRKHLRRAFLCTYTSECLFYVLRKAPAVVKSAWQEDLGLSVARLGAIDSLFLGGYTACTFVAGWLCQRFGGRVMVATALAGSAVSCAAVAMFPYGYAGADGRAVAVLMALSCVHGGFQAMGYPACVSIMTAWTHGPRMPIEQRATIMGTWGTNVAVGGVLGTALGAELAGARGWRAAFVVPCPALVLAAACAYCLIADAADHPPRVLPALAAARVDGAPYRAAAGAGALANNERGGQSEDEDEDEDEDEAGALLGTRASNAALDVAGSGGSDAVIDADTAAAHDSDGCAALWPGVPAVCFAYGCVKFARYCLMLWLPFYHHVALGFDVTTSGLLATSFEIGGIFGSLLVSWLGARGAHKRGGTGWNVGASALLVLAAAVLLLLYSVLTQHRLVGASVPVMAAVGLSIGAGDFSLPTLVAQDLARRSGRGEVRVVGRVVGAVNGCGSLGTVLQGPVTAWVVSRFGWGGVFWLLILLCATCSVTLTFAGPLQAEQREAADAAEGAKLPRSCTGQPNQLVEMVPMPDTERRA
eukprot:g3069.t1